MSSTGGIDTSSFEASIAHLNAETASHRHEAQAARASERRAFEIIRERDRVIRALNAQNSALAAKASFLQARLDAHLLIEDGYRRLVALYAGAEGDPT